MENSPAPASPPEMSDTAVKAGHFAYIHNPRTLHVEYSYGQNNHP